MKTAIIALLCLILISILISCNPPKNAYSTDTQESNARESSKILFLDYQLKRDSATATYDAQLISMIIKKGTIKDDQNHTGQPNENDLELLVLDSNEHTMFQRYIPNPLDKSVEYVNDARQLEQKIIHLDSAQFSVRLQIEPGASSIILNRIKSDNNEETLLLNTPIL
jgi:hypothetical protein